MKKNILVFSLVACSLSFGCASMPETRSSMPRVAKHKVTTATAVAPDETLSPYPGKDETLNPFGNELEVKRRPMLVPRLPPLQEVGFVYRPPRGFEHQNPRSHTFVNDTKYAARIFVDGTELRQVTNGTVTQTPVVWNGGTRFLPLLPPDAKLYNIGDSDEHTILVELYAGPAPLQYAMTCKIEVNYLKQQTVYLSYRACHKGNPSI